MLAAHVPQPSRLRESAGAVQRGGTGIAAVRDHGDHLLGARPRAFSPQQFGQQLPPESLPRVAWCQVDGAFNGVRFALQRGNARAAYPARTWGELVSEPGGGRRGYGWREALYEAPPPGGSGHQDPQRHPPLPAAAKGTHADTVALHCPTSVDRQSTRQCD